VYNFQLRNVVVPIRGNSWNCGRLERPQVIRRFVPPSATPAASIRHIPSHHHAMCLAAYKELIQRCRDQQGGNLMNDDVYIENE
jgi:hypothetical protein